MPPYKGHPWAAGSGPAPEQESVRTWLFDMDNALVAAATVKWEYPDPINGFSDYTEGGAWGRVRYRHAMNGVVYLEGVVTHSGPLGAEDAPLSIFELPDEVRPSNDLMFIVPSAGLTISTVTVQNGAVCWGGYITVGEGAEGYISLCGISWSVEE